MSKRRDEHVFAGYKMPVVSNRKEAKEALQWLLGVADRLESVANGRPILPHDARVYANGVKASVEQVRSFMRVRLSNTGKGKEVING